MQRMCQKVQLMLDYLQVTVQLCLCSSGVCMRELPEGKAFLQSHHRSHCLNYAKQTLDKPETFWNEVLWIDETKVQLFGNSHKEQIWKGKVKHLKLANSLLCAGWLYYGVCVAVAGIRNTVCNELAKSLSLSLM